jgi:hypothetical protein
LVPRAINDAFKLTLDAVFLPRKGQPNYERNELNVFDVSGYENNENMW